MSLLVQTRTVHSVDYRDLDMFLTETFGREHEFVPMMESSNDITHETTVSAAPLDDYDQAEVDEWIAGGNPGSWGIPYLLMNVACQRGLIPAGDYTIRVCW